MSQCAKKQRHRRKLNLAACLGPAYYLNCLFGLFPGRCDLQKCKRSDEYDVIYKAPFYTSRFAKYVGFGFWSCMTVTYVVTNVTRKMGDITDALNVTCVGISFTSIYYFCLVHSSDEIIGCFNTCYHLLQRRRYTDNNYFSEIFFIFFPILKTFTIESLFFYFQLRFIISWFHLLTLVVIGAELGMYTCIMTLCLAVQIVFDDINKRLKSIKSSPVSKEINDLMRLHWRAGEFADSLSKCFGSIALVTAGLNLLRFVILFVKLGNLFVTTSRVNGIALYASIECAKIAWIFISICVRSQRMTSKALEAKYHLQKIMCGKRLSVETVELLYLFKVQTGLREICFSAQGCFKYNMKSVVLAGHVVVAYIVAFIQMK